MSSSTDLSSPQHLSPWFLGSYGENNETFEKILLELLRDHIYWRRNFHPEDEPAIATATQYSPAYLDAVAATKRELHQLTAQLKRSVPFYHPRYIGHMASELLLPGLIAQLVTTLYNPNNIVEDVAPVTARLELEVGRQLAVMLGYNIDPAHARVALGHLTSGGTVANYEALCLARALRYFSVALRSVAISESLPLCLSSGSALAALDDLHAFQLPVSEILSLKHAFEQQMRAADPETAQRCVAVLQRERFESLGAVAFAARHPQVAEPVVLVPTSAHYSWQKAMKLLGLGTAQLRNVRTREMRMCGDDLRRVLDSCQQEKQAVLAVVGVLGTTEFGALDPIQDIVALRREWRREGRDFWLHVDAAWGGYLPSVFRDAEGRMRPHAQVREGFKYFPSTHVYESVAALQDSDSVTIDPHKLGFVPFGAGAFVARDRRVFDCIVQDASYVFVQNADDEQRFRHIGRYILEGSKPGAAAAACYVNHRVLPLHAEGFGQLIAQSVHNAERCYDVFRALAQQLRDRVIVAVPFEPGCNLICLTVNPVGNRGLAGANALARALYERLRVDANVPVQTREYFGSCTTLRRADLSDDDAQRICQALNVDARSFVQAMPDAARGEADHVFVLRHTLMNPWLRTAPNAETVDYLTAFAAWLAHNLDDLMSA